MTFSRSRRNGSVLLKVLIVGGIFVVVAGLLFAFLIAASRGGSIESKNRSGCKNTFWQIWIALHNYHDDYGSFPPAYTTDDDGNKLHSWRTLLLPYVVQKELYDAIDLTKLWDDPVNKLVCSETPEVYLCPGAYVDNNMTIYLGNAAEGGLFSTSDPVQMSDITDGTSNTLAVMEVPLEHAVHWMSPNDADDSVMLSFSETTKTSHSGGFYSLLVDGSVRFLLVNTDKETLKKLFTINGGEVVGEY